MLFTKCVPISRVPFSRQSTKMASSTRIPIPSPGDEREEEGVGRKSQGLRGMSVGRKEWFESVHVQDGWLRWLVLAFLRDGRARAT